MGRPLKFKTPEELQKKIDAYFDDYCWGEVPILKETKSGQPVYTLIKKQTKPYTVTGLAVYLDTTRETLLDYQKKDKFSDTIKKAKLRIHNYAEEQLYRSGQVAGPIFNLKNNWAWKDSTVIEGGDKPVKIVVTDKDE